MFKDEKIIKSQQRFRSDHHKVYTEDVFMICKNEMLFKNKFSDKQNNESQVLRNKSQTLRNEAQSLRNKSHVLRNELQELRNKAQVPRN